MWTHLITTTKLFIFEAKSCKNFEVVFLKPLFFKSSTLNAYVSESFALRRLGEVSIDPRFYLVLGSGHNSVPQKWDLFRWMYTYVYHGVEQNSIEYPPLIKSCTYRRIVYQRSTVTWVRRNKAPSNTQLFDIFKPIFLSTRVAGVFPAPILLQRSFQEKEGWTLIPFSVRPCYCATRRVSGFGDTARMTPSKVHRYLKATACIRYSVTDLRGQFSAECSSCCKKLSNMTHFLGELWVGWGRGVWELF